MKGIVLAGGTGSRLMPLSKVTNKHLLPVGRMPMIYHPLLKLREAGVTDIMIVTGREHMGDVVGLLGSGSELGISLTFRVQDEAGGIAQALGLAKGFAAGGPVAVLLGDNIFEDSIAESVREFRNDPSGAKIMLKCVDDPTRFGVATLDESCERVVRIVEKPAEPETDLAVTGIYFYGPRVFEIVRTLKPSGRGELEITDVNNAYIEAGEMSFGVLQGWWTDAGTHTSYVHAGQLAADIEIPEEGAS